MEIGTTSNIIGDKIIFTTVQNDSDTENPLDWDGSGNIISFCRTHPNYKHPDEIEANPDSIKLSYYEHGSCIWFVQGLGEAGTDCRFDGVRTAGVWTPDDSIMEWIDKHGEPGSEKRIQYLTLVAAESCENYSSWVNGECYYISMKVYELKTEDGHQFDELSDYRFAEPLWDYSVGGLVGYEDLESEVDNVHRERMLALPETAMEL